MSEQNRDEWALPTGNDTQHLPAKAEMSSLTAQHTPVMTFDHEGRTHRIPIAIWLVSEELIVATSPKQMIYSIHHPDKISVIIPLIDENVDLGFQVMKGYYEEIGRKDFVTTPETAGVAVERAFGIGDAYAIGVMITIGENLKRDSSEATRMASEAIMNEVDRQRQQRQPARVR